MYKIAVRTLCAKVRTALSTDYIRSINKPASSENSMTAVPICRTVVFFHISFMAGERCIPRCFSRAEGCSAGKI